MLLGNPHVRKRVSVISVLWCMRHYTAYIQLFFAYMAPSDAFNDMNIFEAFTILSDCNCALLFKQKEANTLTAVRNINRNNPKTQLHKRFNRKNSSGWVPPFLLLGQFFSRLPSSMH